MTDFEMLSWGKRKSEEAPQEQGRETGGGRRGKRSRGRSAPGGRAGCSVSGQRGRAERTDRRRVQDVSGSRLGERGRSNGRGGSDLPRIRWRNQEQARSGARRGSRTARFPARACVGGVPAQPGSDEGAGARTRGSAEVVLGEQRGEERAGAAGGARTALSSEAVQENRGQGRLDARRVLPGPGYSHPRGSAGSSTAAAERSEEARPRPKRPPRARSVEAPNTDTREVERLAHRVEQNSLRMAELLRLGVLEPSMVHAFLMTKGGQQVPQAKSKAKARARSREMMSEKECNRLLMCRPLVHSLREAAHGVSEARNAGTLDCSPKSTNITEKPTAEYWGSCSGMTIFSPTWTQLNGVFLNSTERFCMALVQG